ncbi:TetR/AcrR family transcriptional regulator [Egbenema bharatensis]|uniref:TetR/AcrR family transcriptional regulator n=1 Tax=Egbenema bharatensis TaxID=3463334 RepID=UPI003A85DF45
MKTSSQAASSQEISSQEPIAHPSNAKREQILQGAMQVFLEQGYANTSMDRVAAAAGVSKQTIYSHFQDKEGLFTALIQRVTIERIQPELRADVLQGEPEVVLRRLANVYFDQLTSAEYLALIRVVIAESNRFPELAQLYTRTVIQRGRQILSDFFRSHPELEIADPEATAHIFFGSLVSFLISQEILYGKQIMPLAPEQLIDTLVPMVLNRGSHY